MSEEKGSLDCELCGLRVERDVYRLETAGKTLHFCCDGCKGIYQILHDVEAPPQQPAGKGRGGAA